MSARVGQLGAGARVLAYVVALALILCVVPGGILNPLRTRAANVTVGEFAQLKAYFAEAESNPDSHYTIKLTKEIEFTETITASAGNIILIPSEEEYKGVKITLVAPANSRHFELTGDVSVRMERLILEGRDQGGGIEMLSTGGLHLSDSTLRNNKTSGNGGALYVGPRGYVTLTGVIMTGNAAAAGGGIYNHGEVTVMDFESQYTTAVTEISYNRAGNGGGVYNDATYTEGLPGGDDDLQQFTNGAFKMEGGEIQENSASGNGGGVSNVSGGSIELRSVVVYNNTAGTNGGGIYATDGTYNRIEDTYNDTPINPYSLPSGVEGINENKAVNGGGLYMKNAELRLTGVLVGHNVASGYGGGAYIEGSGDDPNYPYFEATYIKDNRAANGGGLALKNASINSGFVRENIATGNGGGVYLMDGGVFTVPDDDRGSSSLQSNDARNGGGAYLNGSGALLKVEGGTVLANAATEDGGGVYVENGRVNEGSWVTSYFDHNSAGGAGGAIYTKDYTYVTIGGGSEFEGNISTAPYVLEPDTASKAYHKSYVAAGTVFSEYSPGERFEYGYNNYDINYIDLSGVEVPTPKITGISAEPVRMSYKGGTTIVTIEGENLDLLEDYELGIFYQDHDNPGDDYIQELYDFSPESASFGFELDQNDSLTDDHLYTFQPAMLDQNPGLDESPEFVVEPFSVTVTVLKKAASIESLTADPNELDSDGGETVLTIEGENLDVYDVLRIRNQRTNETLEADVADDGFSASAPFDLDENTTSSDITHTFEVVSDDGVGPNATVVVKGVDTDPKDPDPEDPDPEDPDPEDPDPEDPDPEDPDPEDPDPEDPDPEDPDPEDPDPLDPVPDGPDPEGEYRGGRGGSGFHGGGQYWRGPAIFDILEHQADMAVTDYWSQWNEEQIVGDDPTVAVQNAGYITKAQLERAASGAREANGKANGPDVTLMLDSTVQGENGLELQGRIYLNPEQVTEDIYTGVYTSGSDVDRTQAIFRGLGLANAQVVSLQQRGDYGVKVEIAADVDLSALNTANLQIYSYDPYTGEYQQLDSSTAYVDEAGYLHFFTDVGGDIVVADRALGSASGTLSGVDLKKEDQQKLDVKEPEEEPGKDLDFAREE